VLLAAGTIPLVALARPIGRLVDAHDSRRLLVAGGLAEAAATVPLIFLHAVVPIVVLVAVLGAATSVTASTWSALMPRIAGDDGLARAVSTQQSLSLLVMVGAPAIGGVLAGTYGSGLPVAIDAATFVAIALAATLIRTRRVPAPTVEESTRGGLAILRADRVLAPLLAGVAFVVLLVGMVDVVLVFLVRETLHAGGVWYGVAEASWVAGMVAGAVGAGRVRTQPGQVRATIAGVALACAGLAFFTLAQAVWILIPLSIVGGIGNGYAGACASTLLLARTPDSARGRVSATANAVLGGAQGASVLLGGAVAIALSPRAVYATAGVLGLTAAGFLAVHTASRWSLVTESTPQAPRIEEPAPSDAVT